MSSFFYRKSTLLNTIIITAITFGYLFLVFLDAAKCFEVDSSNISLGTSFGFSTMNVQEFFSIRNSKMINCYQEFLSIWDNIFALLYGLMYVGWLSFILKPFQNKCKAMNLLPFTQTIFDWLENLKLYRIANNYLESGKIMASDVQIASIFNQIKWSVTGMVFLLILIGIAMRLYENRKSTKIT